MRVDLRKQRDISAWFAARGLRRLRCKGASAIGHQIELVGQAADFIIAAFEDPHGEIAKGYRFHFSGHFLQRRTIIFEKTSASTVQVAISTMAVIPSKSRMLGWLPNEVPSEETL